MSADVAVIGGGPAGLMAAEVLATAGHRVAVYERHRSVGRKFLLAGRSGLNLTHTEPHESLLERFVGASPTMIDAVTAFDTAAVREWASGLGVETFIGSSGRVFPEGMRAAPLLRAWLARLSDLDVKWHGQHDFVGWSANGELRFRTPSGERAAAAEATVLAFGGASWPRVSSAGQWAEVLASAGHEIEPLRAANVGVPVAWTEVFRDRFEGEPVKNVVVSAGGRSVRGEVVVTKKGLEGGPIYALSSRLDPTSPVHLDLAPDLDDVALVERLGRGRAKDSQSTRLRKAGLAPVAIGLLRESTGNQIPQEATALAELVRSVPIALDGVGNIDRAISTAGGLAVAEVDDLFMLRSRPGVFAAGEMLAWDAPTGGYLLHGCLATGRAAGEGARRYLS